MAGDVVIIGAGMAGLTAARTLNDKGHRVIVLDKAQRPGGRLATKGFVAGGRADSGAQFFTVRSDEFAEAVGHWEADGLVREWCRGFDGDDGHPRYAVTGGMGRLAATLARRAEVYLSHHVQSIRMDGAKVAVEWPEAYGHRADFLSADAVIITTPVPQAAEIVGHLVAVPSISYESTLSLMVAPDRDVEISKSGGIMLTDHPVWSFIGDNQAKGTSPRPSVTFHTTAQFAAAHQDMTGPDPAGELLEAARPFLGPADILEALQHRWRYATPITPYPARRLCGAGGRIILAGDAFGGPRVEGAYLSGLAAAQAVLDRA